MHAFVGPKPEGMTTNHKNGVKHDNRLENLEYVSHAENIRHSIQVLGNTRHGERHPMSILTDDQVRSIHAEVCAGGIRREIADRHGVNVQAIHAIMSGRTWKHLNLPRVGFRKGVRGFPDETVREIRRRKQAGERVIDLAREFGVHQSHISKLCNFQRGPRQ